MAYKESIEKPRGSSDRAVLYFAKSEMRLMPQLR